MMKSILLLSLKALFSAKAETGNKDETFPGRTGAKGVRGVAVLSGGDSLRRGSKHREKVRLRPLPGRPGGDRRYAGRAPVFRRRGQIGGTAPRGACSGQPALALPGESTRCHSGLHRALYLARVRGALQAGGQGVGGQPGVDVQREKAPGGSGVGPENGRRFGARRAGEDAGGMVGKLLV